MLLQARGMRYESSTTSGEDSSNGSGSEMKAEQKKVNKPVLTFVKIVSSTSKFVIPQSILFDCRQ